jgi:hypothetical protein
VNEGGDEGWPITSNGGLMPVEQLIMQIDAQVNPTMPLMYGEFIKEVEAAPLDVTLYCKV